MEKFTLAFFVKYIKSVKLKQKKMIKKKLKLEVNIRRKKIVLLLVIFNGKQCSFVMFY